MIRAGDPRLLLLVPIALLLSMLATSAPAVIAPDTYFGIFWGQEIAHHGLPRVDYLNELTPGSEWVDQQWLSHLLYYGLWEAGGERLMVILQLLGAGGAFTLALLAGWRRGASPHRLMLVGCAAPVAMLSFMDLRAQLLVEVLFVACAVLLSADTQKPSRRVWWIVPMLLLWANLHGSILIASGLVGLAALFHLAKRRYGRAAIFVALAAAAPFASPYGLDLAGYYASTLGNSAFYESIEEWKPPTLQSYPALFVALLALTWALCQPRERRGWTGFEVALVPCLMIASLTSARYAIWLLLATIWLLALPLDRALGPVHDNPRFNRWLTIAAIAAITISLGVMATDPGSRLLKAWPDPQLATDIADRVEGPILAEPRLANWLMLQEPRLRGRLAVDGRLELIRGDEADAVATGLYAGWGYKHEALAERYDLLVISLHSHGPLVARMREQPELWTCEEQQDVALCEPSKR